MTVPNFYDDAGGWPMAFGLAAVAVVGVIIGLWLGLLPWPQTT